MKMPKITEEFLWKLFELQEKLEKLYETVGPRSMRDVLLPEMRKLRLEYKRKKRGRTFSQLISNLKRTGYIKVPEGKALSAVLLTKKGREMALQGKIKITGLSPRKDGKMILLMYDIPKVKQNIRHAFRSRIEFLGYQLLQKSVWVSDKDVLEETERAIREYDLGDCINLFIIEKIKL